MRITVFGGAFDPVHKGHLNIALFVLLRKIAEKIIFVPTLYPPHKGQKAVASFEDRLEMLKIALRDNPDFEISDIEKSLNKNPSFTFDMMNALSEKYPQSELIILIGADSLMNLHLWHRAKEIVEKWRIITYKRPKFGIIKKELIKIWGFELAKKLTDGIIPDCPLFELASSQIRCNILRKGNYEGLDEKVAEYIKTKALYK